MIRSTLPAENLQNYFLEYYYISLNSGDTVKSIPIIDDCSYDFVFHKEANAILSFGRPSKKIKSDCRIFTVHDLVPPYKISFKGDLNFFTIKLQPWQNGSFFSNLQKNGIIDVSQIISPDMRFYDEIFEMPEPKDRFALADKLLQTISVEESDVKSLVQSMCQTIQARQGKISVNEISEQYQKSRQYLNKVFKKHVLYGLKKYITTVRILSVVKHKSRQPDLSLTELAYQYGYFDQAHFINDFKNVCGVNPRYFFSNLPEFMLRHQ